MPAAAPTGGAVLLSELTTIGLGGPASSLIPVTTADEVAEVLGGAPVAGAGAASTVAAAAATTRAAGPAGTARAAVEAEDRPPLVLGGGSNLVVADDGVDVPVVRIAIRGLQVTDRSPEGALLTVGAGENWDDVVEAAVAEGFTGIETLSGIPGSAGATPVQNVGAYGTEIAEVLADVDLFDRRAGVPRRVPAAELGLGYRTSVLRGSDRAVVTAVRLRLGRAPRPVRYAELARTLGVAVGVPVPAAVVREAVLELRRSKGMVLDPGDPDTRSAGSFFTNPVLDGDALAATRRAIEDRLGPDARYPSYPAEHGTKLSAAWLIERAGFGRGFALPGHRMAISTKHTLALTNRGGGTTAELLELAGTIRDGVRAAFAVTLEPEPVLVGVRLGG